MPGAAGFHIEVRVAACPQVLGGKREERETKEGRKGGREGSREGGRKGLRKGGIGRRKGGI